ncbi:MAG: cation transporter [Bacteroidetes bacterium]|nr:cation transporter [Bacteroidota bacterium]
MKKHITTIFLIVALLSGRSVFAQSDNGSKYDTITIQTSAVCQQCKDRLEHDMAFEKGVKAVSLDLDTKVLTVIVKKGKNTKENLKKAVTKIGYDADDLAADTRAYDRLPDCCKKDAPPH